MVFEPNLDKNMFDEVLDIKEMCQARANPPNFLLRGFSKFGANLSKMVPFNWGKPVM